jgi:hypothetical protein
MIPLTEVLEVVQAARALVVDAHERRNADHNHATIAEEMTITVLKTVCEEIHTSGTVKRLSAATTQQKTS